MNDPIARLRTALADRYRIERELGQGGMATVYLAEDLRHHRQVAVKVLRQDLAATLGPDRFVREIEVAAQLHHPHILPLYDSGDADGFLFYVMPYESGQSLRQRLEREHELPVRDVVRLLHDVADALAHAHEHGLVHRDIKPENVLLSGRHALVTDFGVAKAVSDATGRQKLTTMGVALGTPAYMAPEQAAADPHIDHRADIYALGVMGYELLTGTPPFGGLTPQAILAAQVTQAPVPVSEHRPTVPPALAALIMRCLEKRASDRYQSTAEILPVLEALTTPSGGTTPFETAPYRAPVTRSRWIRRGALAAGALGVLGLLGWLGWRELRPRAATIEISNIRQVTREPVPEIHVALSPDGREVAYESGYPGGTHIVVRDVSGGRPVELTADWAGAQVTPRWMPGGQEVTFMNLKATPDHAAGPWKVPRLGGTAERPDSADRRAMAMGMPVAVHGDSTFRIEPDGREQLLDPGGGHSPTVRADGSAVAWVRGNSDYLSSWGNVAPSEIWVAVSGREPVRVTDGSSLNMSPAWLPDGSLLFVSNRDGARDIYSLALTRSGTPAGAPVRLTTGLEAYSVSVSADGNRAAYERFIFRRNIFALPLPGTGVVSASDAPPAPVTTGNQSVENFDISDDGAWLAFDSNLEGNQDIFVQRVAGGELRRVTRDPGDDFSPDFSPRGDEIAFHSTRNPTRDIYVIRTDGTGEQRLTTDEEESLHPAFSPDGLSIAYGNTSQTIYLLRRDAIGDPWQKAIRLPIPSGFAPRWSPDGSRLVYHVTTGDGAIGVLTLGDTARAVVTGKGTGLRSLRWPEWSRDGRLIYFYATGADGVSGLYQVPAGGGTPTLRLRGDVQDMSPFGGSVLVAKGSLYVALGDFESDIYLVDLVRR